MESHIDPPTPKKFLRSDAICSVGFGSVALIIDNHVIWCADEEDVTVKMLSKVFRRQIEDGKEVCLRFDAPLWDATYTRNQDGRWQLTKRGPGFA